MSWIPATDLHGWHDTICKDISQACTPYKSITICSYWAAIIETAIYQTATLTHLPLPSAGVSRKWAPGNSVLICTACRIAAAWISIIVRTISQNMKCEDDTDDKVSKDHHLVGSLRRTLAFVSWPFMLFHDSPKVGSETATVATEWHMRDLQMHPGLRFYPAWCQGCWPCHLCG